MLSYPFFRGKGDKFFSHNIKNQFFLFPFSDIKCVFWKIEPFQGGKNKAKWQKVLIP